MSKVSNFEILRDKTSQAKVTSLISHIACTPHTFYMASMHITKSQRVVILISRDKCAHNNSMGTYGGRQRSPTFRPLNWTSSHKSRFGARRMIFTGSKVFLLAQTELYKGTSLSQPCLHNFERLSFASTWPLLLLEFRGESRPTTRSGTRLLRGSRRARSRVVKATLTAAGKSARIQCPPHARAPVFRWRSPGQC